MEIVLYHPEIAGNVGAIIRLSANTGIPLNIVEPTGIDFDSTKIKRAGLDYHDIANVTKHNNWNIFKKECVSINSLITTSKSNNKYWKNDLTKTDYIIFGSESVGLPNKILTEFKQQAITIPMDTESRSINLANAVAIISYEYLRQIETK